MGYILQKLYTVIFFTKNGLNLTVNKNIKFGVCSF